MPLEQWFANASLQVVLNRCPEVQDFVNFVGVHIEKRNQISHGLFEFLLVGGFVDASSK